VRPWTALPDVDFTAPEITVPEITVPEVTVPEVTVSEITVPEIAMTEITGPEITALFDHCAVRITKMSELHSRRFCDRGRVVHLEEVTRREAETLCERVVRERLDFRVEISNTAVVEPA
jgi:hypothetical protein